MTRPKTAGAYTASMLDILDRMEQDPDTAIEVFFPTEKQAKNFRLNFYSFRSAGIKEGMETMYPNMKAVEMRTAPDGVLTIEHKDHTLVTKLIEEGLELAKKKADQRKQEGDSGVRDGTNRTTDGTIGQP